VGGDLGDVMGRMGGRMLGQARGFVGLPGMRIALACLTEVYAATASVAAALVAVTLLTSRAAGATHAGGAPRRRLEIPRLAPPAAAGGIDAEPAADGHALCGSRLTDFRQRDPRDGEPCTRATTAWVAYDDDNLVVQFDCADDPALVRAHLTRRDAID